MTAPELWGVIQAEGSGVTGTRSDGSLYEAKRLSTVAPGGFYTLLSLPPGVNRATTLAFARAQVGDRYGYLTDASEAIDIASPDWFHFPFRRPGTWICSALGMESVRAGGGIYDWPDIYNVTPAEGYGALIDGGAKVITIADAQPGDVGFCHSKGVIGKGIRVAQWFDGEKWATYNHMFVLDRQWPA